MQYHCEIINSVLDQPTRVLQHVHQLLLISLIYNTLVGNGASLSTRVIPTAVGDTWSPTLSIFSCNQHDISITRELYCILNIIKGHQHVAEEVCGVGVAVGTFWTMLSVVLIKVSWWGTMGSKVGCQVVLIELNSVKTKWCIYWDVIIHNF